MFMNGSSEPGDMARMTGFTLLCFTSWSSRL